MSSSSTTDGSTPTPTGETASRSLAAAPHSSSREARWSRRRRRHARRHARHWLWAAVRRIVIGVIGVATMAVGLVLVPLPGPGWAIVFAGVAILATEFPWAHKLLVYARRKIRPYWKAVLNWYRRRFGSRLGT